MRKITCHCEQEFTVDFPEVVNLDDKPELIAAIQNGVFLSCICPACKTELNTELPTRIEWPSKNLNLDFVPEIERFSWFAAQHKTENSLQTVIGYPELADRISVLASNLEPAAVEAIKFYLLASSREAKALQKISFVFEKITESGELEFHIHGLKENEIAVSRIQRHVYDSVLEKYRKAPNEDPFPSLFFGSYLSVQNVLIEDEAND